MREANRIPIDELKKVFNYDPDTGVFTRIIAVRGMRKGSVAGGFDDRGYQVLGRKGSQYKAHRVAWAWIHGDSDKLVDHINGIRSDNRIANLRIADICESNMNRKLQSNSTTGFKGVHPNKRSKINPWKAEIEFNGKWLYLGSFQSPEEAGEAYKQAAIKYHGEFDYFTSQSMESR